MSNPEENQPAEIAGGLLPTQTATVVSNHEGEDGMGSRSMTIGRYEEIRRRLAEGRGLREIARALNCSRDTVREVRDGARHSPDAPKPLFRSTVDVAGEIRKAYVFVAGLGFSQLLYAWAAEDMKSRNWLGAHRRMFNFYGGVPHVTVPDCLKQGVLKIMTSAISCALATVIPP